MKENRKREGGLLLVLPVLALPFLAFAFWALGGGHSSGVNTEKVSGINAELPNAKPGDDSALDKMAFYDQAEKAAGKSATDSLNDRGDSLDSRLRKNAFEDTRTNAPNYSGIESSNYGPNQRATGQNETHIRQRMQELQHQLEVQSNGGYPGEEFGSASRISSLQSNGNRNTEVMSQPAIVQDTTDAEMEQLQSMMNRIYDIQHPDEVVSRLKVASERNRGILYPVMTAQPENTIHFLSVGSNGYNDSIHSSALSSYFYGLPTSGRNDLTGDKAIQAVTQEDQMLVNGASIKLRLQQDVYANGLLVTKGTLVTGQVQLNNDRLQVEVTSLLARQNLIQVKLAAYDTDGMEGLNIPGSINRDVVRQSSDNTLQGIGVGTINPSIGAQAAAAGIETAKTLFSRKLKLTKVFVEAGHQLLLKNQ